MADAAAAGALPHHFWDYTLRELTNALRGARQRDQRALDLAITGAWHAASFQRGKRLPRLDRVLKLLRPAPKQSPQDQRAFFLALHEQMGGETIDLRKKE